MNFCRFAVLAIFGFSLATPALAQNHESTLATLILKPYKLLRVDPQVMDDFDKYVAPFRETFKPAQ